MTILTIDGVKDTMGVELYADELKSTFPNLTVLTGEPMKNHCSFRIGGPAALFLEPSSEQDLAALRRFLGEKKIPCVFLGNGTNLLVCDEGPDCAVVHLGEAFGRVHIEGETLIADAGVSLAHLASAARDSGLAGLEFAHGIPGSLGGAVMMNAGAYGGEMKDVVVSVRYMDENGTTAETDAPGVAYRKSVFSGSSHVILGAKLQLKRDAPEAIHARMMELWAKRSASQPLDKPSAGSFFKRPANGYAAAMIEGAGLKGRSVGGAQVSEKHAGFLINAGGATCADVTALMEQVQEAVFETYGTRLEPEVRFLR